MTHPKNFYNLLFVVDDLSSAIVKKIDDYENLIQGSNTIKKDFYNIEFVYMHSIVLDMAKLLSVTKSDKSGLIQLKDISPEEIESEIAKFEQDNKKIIEKITNNRNRIISHVDISDGSAYFDMGISEHEFKNKIDDYRRYLAHFGDVDENKIRTYEESLQKIKSTSSENERYRPPDFIVDLPVLKSMSEKISKFAHDINIYYYNMKL